MTKKEIEKRIAQLEAKVTELQGQLLTLALKTPNAPTWTPVTQPITIPVPAWPPYVPYVGDFPPAPGQFPTISCQSTQNTQSSDRNIRCLSFN